MSKRVYTWLLPPAGKVMQHFRFHTKRCCTIATNRWWMFNALSWGKWTLPLPLQEPSKNGPIYHSAEQFVLELHLRVLFLLKGQRQIFNLVIVLSCKMDKQKWAWAKQFRSKREILILSVFAYRPINPYIHLSQHIFIHIIHPLHRRP